MLKPGLLERLAWRRYLTATRASSSRTYPVIEKRAWLRLQQDFARLGSPLSADRSSVAEPAAVRARAGRRG
jgi:hypothetical protein